MPSINTVENTKDYMWVVLGDIHNDMSRFNEIPELAQAQGIIITGDMTFNGGVKEAELVLNAAKEKHAHVLAQIGNMDKPEVTDWLKALQCNMHAEVRELAPDVAILGVGASTITPFNTPSEFPESYFAERLQECWDNAQKWPQHVLISHNPPKDTLCDVIAGGVHVGSTAVREFIEKNQPEICICGHIHESRAVDSIGRTVIINPGDFSAGGYVLLRLQNGQLSAELKVLSNGS